MKKNTVDEIKYTQQYNDIIVPVVEMFEAKRPPF